MKIPPKYEYKCWGPNAEAEYLGHRYHEINGKKKVIICDDKECAWYSGCFRDRKIEGEIMPDRERQGYNRAISQVINKIKKEKTNDNNS